MAITGFIQVRCKLGKAVKILNEGWDLISTIKHQELAGRLQDLIDTLQDPATVIQSGSDETVYLYYRKLEKYLLVAVLKHYNGTSFLITAYLTDYVKKGKKIL